MRRARRAPKFPLPRFAALAFVLLLASCGGRPTVSPPGPPQPSLLLNGPACVAALADRGIGFARVDDFRNGQGCGVETAISLSRSTATMNTPVTVGCTLALVMNSYEREVVQPAAIRHFGQPVTRIHHMGAYACRNRSSGGGRLSEHALGRAIDIGAFELQDGTMIRVRSDWRGGGTRSAFLDDVSQGACRLFSVVLTPNHDRDHHDHLHLDLGPWRLCGV
ncbi:MAG TPA: extensin family protein [Alphaproteobacteria bacterium]|nr:extensin family protein [Alphaproteobacteria bacterium]